MKMLNLFTILFLITTLFANCQNGSQTAEKTSYSYSIPTTGNSWVVENSSKNREVIRPEGIKNWSEENVKIRTYFRVENAGKLELGMVARSYGGPSTIKVSGGNFSQNSKVENNDVMGSFFMACGFGQGYFGMQVNSPTERRILFSVWSPFQTDNPEEIPKEDRIVLLKKGEDVYTGEFGNEGSGGQSFLRYNWKAGNTYRFLLKGVPTGNGETDFSKLP